MGRRNVGPVLLLIFIACGASHERANATALQGDLSEMRKAIRDYTADKRHPPATLDELVRAKYLRSIPADPVTGKPDWRVMVEQSVRVDEFQTAAPPPSTAGVIDVHSSAPGTDSNGKAWSDY